MDTSLVLIILLSLVVMVILYYVFFKNKEEYELYTKDTLYNIPWRWEWRKGEIINLKCFCPHCDDMLVYENDYTLHKTYFICVSCETQRATIGGGDSKYAFGMVKREINRKVRTKEFKNTQQR